MNVLSYAAHSATASLEPFSLTRRALREDDVIIDILYCGVCHTDLHLARNHGGFTTYPIVPGHEIIGRVRQVGAQVSRVRVDQLVGVGCMVDSCQQCQPCLHGWEQNCLEGSTFTYNSKDRRDGSVTFGGYSQAIVVREEFVLSLPLASIQQGLPRYFAQVSRRGHRCCTGMSVSAARSLSLALAGSVIWH